MESPQRIVVPLGRIIKVPAVRCIVAFHQVHIFLHPDFIHRQSVFPEADVHQDPEKTPVVFRHIMQVDLVQPVIQVLPLLLVQRIPEVFRRKAQSAADHRHFHHPLVKRTNLSPVFLMVRIGSVDHSFQPQRPEFLCLRAFPRQHRHKRP